MSRTTDPRARALRASALRPVVFGLAAVGLGLGIHLLGAGTRASCMAILIAGLGGLLPTLFAHRTLRGSLRSAVQAALTVSLGQLTMHVSLTAPALSSQVDPGDFLSGRLLFAHGVATAVLIAYLLGLQRTVQLVLEVYARLRTWLRMTFSARRLGPVLKRSLCCAATSDAFVRPLHRDAHGRRGPPLTA